MKENINAWHSAINQIKGFLERVIAVDRFLTKFFSLRTTKENWNSRMGQR